MTIGRVSTTLSIDPVERAKEIATAIEERNGAKLHLERRGDSEILYRKEGLKNRVFDKLNIFQKSRKRAENLIEQSGFQSDSTATNKTERWRNYDTRINEYNDGSLLIGKSGSTYTRTKNLHGSNVFMATRRATSGEEMNVVIKKTTKAEADVFKKISDGNKPNLLKYITSFENKNSQGVGDEIYLVMEACPNGDIDKLCPLLAELDKTDSEKALLLRRYVSRKVLDAVTQLHELKLGHGDIKPAQFLITADGDIKLADFGTAGEFSRKMVGRDSLVDCPIYQEPDAISAKNECLKKTIQAEKKRNARVKELRDNGHARDEAKSTSLQEEPNPEYSINVEKGDYYSAAGSLYKIFFNEDPWAHNIINKTGAPGEWTAIENQISLRRGKPQYRRFASAARTSNRDYWDKQVRAANSTIRSGMASQNGRASTKGMAQREFFKLNPSDETYCKKALVELVDNNRKLQSNS